MSITIKRWDDGKVIYTSTTAKNIKEALEQAVADNVSLNYADLSKANLYNVDLSEVDLSEVDFYNANLCYANLYNAKLYNAKLYKANLYKANLSKANLYKANLWYAKNAFTFQKPTGRICVAVWHGNYFNIHAGCFWGALNEFEKRAQKAYPDNPIEAYTPQIAMLREIQKLYQSDGQ